ncbi:5-carboxymethyl-2-hydroxymuconate Delta-isomerase [Pseudoxanthomonas sp. z9]|uniref:5-carboxymethyl-2-hydroxymuconate Delta-isomerase n=1 Tax=Pseudoxanthomonas sp. z9 TaxID=2584942 RepID=UPI00114128C0|nr:5-carboxymethyl-2-hydroxymuconate Delta-isomerase [Pseudoxanthomonas sp. z9]
MPHLTLQYTDNLVLDARALLARLNQMLFDSGHFDEEAIKSRAVALSDFLVGTDALAARAFIHARLRVLPGRDEAVRAQLSEALLHALRAHLPAGPHALQICVEVGELPASYRKTSVLPISSPASS